MRLSGVNSVPPASPAWASVVSGTTAVSSRMRQEAAAADIIVNHHLFFADLALKESSFGEVIPRYDAVIFDEAHHLEEVATQHFGMGVSNYRVEELTRDTARAPGPSDSR